MEEADGVPGHDGSVAQGLNLAVLALFHRSQQLDTPSCKKPNECSVYMLIVNPMEKVLDFVQCGGPKWIVGGTIFEMWLGGL